MTPEYQKILLDTAEVAAIIDRLTEKIMQQHPDKPALVLIGIRTGGAHLAARIAGAIAKRNGHAPPVGVVDITFYRDDWTKIANKPQVGPTDIAFPIDEKEVILIDDVLFTGRTVRAALDQLVDLGRPRRIELCVLVDRGHRELPVAADYVGLEVDTGYAQQVEVFLEEEGRPDRVVLIG